MCILVKYKGTSIHFSLIGAMFASIYTQTMTLRNDCVRIAVLENVRDNVSLLHIEIYMVLKSSAGDIRTNAEDTSQANENELQR